MNSAQFTELLMQSLEHERGGVKVYQTAIKCAQRPDLKAEWEKYLSQTEGHVSTLTGLCELFDLDPFTMTPGTQIVKALGNSLVEAMNTALSAGDPQAAQIVAAECVVLAETKDHLDWELLGEAAKTLSGEEREALQEAYEKIEQEEDEQPGEQQRATKCSCSSTCSRDTKIIIASITGLVTALTTTIIVIQRYYN